MLPHKRIAIVTPFFFPTRGGYSTYTLNACKALATKGYKISVYTPSSGDQLESQVSDELAWFKDNDMVTLHHLLPTRKMRFNEKSYLLASAIPIFYPAILKSSTYFDKHLLLEFKRRKYDIVSTHGFPERSIPLGFKAGNVRMHTFHTSLVQMHSRPVRFYFKTLFSFVDIVTAVSAALAEEAKKYLGVNVNNVLYPSVDIQLFRPIKKIVSDDTIKIGMVSLFVWPKKVEGIKLLITALHVLKSKSRVPFRLFLVGSGRLEYELKLFISKLKLKDVVTFMGNMPYSEMPSFYNSIDIYVHISFQEALGIAAIEAMACGRPVLCSHIGGLPEVVDQQTGWLVQNEIRAIVQMLEKAFACTDLMLKKGEASRRKIVKQFSLQAFANKFEILTR